MINKEHRWINALLLKVTVMSRLIAKLNHSALCGLVELEKNLLKSNLMKSSLNWPLLARFLTIWYKNRE